MNAEELEELREERATNLRIKIMDRWLVGRPSGNGRTRLHLAVKMCGYLGVHRNPTMNRRKFA